MPENWTCSGEEEEEESVEECLVFLQAILSICIILSVYELILLISVSVIKA